MAKEHVSFDVPPDDNDTTGIIKNEQCANCKKTSMELRQFITRYMMFFAAMITLYMIFMTWMMYMLIE